MDIQKPLAELVSLKGKRALITGCARGIGEAIAYRIAEAGADLELVDIDEKCLRELQLELRRFQTTINVHRVDLSKKAVIDSLWNDLSGKEPDILINNAGIYPFLNFTELDEKILAKVQDINLNAVIWMCQQMIKRRGERGGVIVNIGTIEAVLPFAGGLVPYGVSKAGVIALTRALAKEYGKQGFRINVILPGGINTPGTRDVAAEFEKLNIKPLRLGLDFMRRLPVGRYGEPDEVACVALFLASDLSGYVHGAMVPVDGGFLSA
jgi:NAD(P)-dependent dehydrogenase (short-subunit alcohol dehydrogenase family)